MPIARQESAAAAQAHPVLAEVVRSGFVEGLHRGSLVVLDADGSVARSLGSTRTPLFPRSSNKPAQAVGMLRAGLELTGRRLALAAASHTGEPFHQELVHALLAEHGLSEEQLGCPPDLPADAAEAERTLAAGRGRSRVAMNCSGKHTAMLVTAAANGWPLHTYLDPAHPLQQRITAAVEDLSGERVAHTAVDGCGAPLLALSLTGLARTFRALVLAAPGSPERRAADAMRAHPEYVAGTGRRDTLLMRELPGVLAKSGAEAVQAVAFPDGSALALKIDDGAARAVGPVLARALSEYRPRGQDAPWDEAVLARLAEAPVLGGGRRVGEVRAAF